MKRARPALTREAIREAALALIDREGLEAFSTRKLGAALGCEAMAIYWHYPNKDALLDAVGELLIAPVAAVVAKPKKRDWIAVLREVAHAYRGIARAHPNAFPLLATRRFASEGSYVFLEHLFELARAQGITDRVTARFYRMVSSYCNGFSLHELARPVPATASTRKTFPRLAAVSTWLEPRHLDEMFRFGLELQLDALAAQTGAKPNAKGRDHRVRRSARA